jgi:hypothetical protein
MEYMLTGWLGYSKMPHIPHGIYKKNEECEWLSKEGELKV